MDKDFYYHRAYTTPYYHWLGFEAEETWYEECLTDEAERDHRKNQNGAFHCNMNYRG